MNWIKSKTINLITLIMAISFAIFIAELLLRMFTYFPINDGTNREYSKHTGYVLSQNFPNIDRRGFRNTNDYDEANLVFIGDSHTYGNNVSYKKSFPYQFGENVYNSGIPRYGNFSYFFFSRTIFK